VAIICDLLREAAGLAPIFSASAAPLWARATLADGRAAQQAADLVSRIAGQRLPELQAALVELAEDIRLPVPDDLRELATFFAYLTQLEKLLTRYSPQLFAQDLGQLVKDLSSAGNPITHAISSAFNSRYRRALECARRLQRAGGEPLRPKQILHDTAMALGLCEVWRKNVAGDTPIPDALPDFHRAQGSSEALRADLQAVTPFLAKVIADWETRKFPGLLRVFGELHADVQTPHQLPRANEIQREIERLGSAAFISHMASKDTHPQAWPDQFRHAWLASCLDAVLAQDASLSGFVGATHNRFVDEFVKLDRGRIALAADRLRRAHAKHAVEVRNQQPEQDSLVQRELQKKRRHIPLRTLLAQAPDVLTAICPCWMASPLSVSQLFATGQRYFDVVLFDEASQVPPEDAAPAIMRATHVVVAGDRHQLPPTKFFASEDSGPEEDEDEPLATAGFESLLDLMSAFTGQWSLDWHYRSRDESLIAFSNRHIYSDRLITFPSTGGALALSHVLVSPNGNDARQADMTRSNPDEAKKVVEMVIEQARSRPQESLGVIALGIKHAQRIQAELDRVLPACPDLEEFFSQGRDEPFFVKNLERVQGDERDAILLSVGYGKDADGKLPYRFGPLLQDGGERRLNVAVTRARSHLALVSSFSHLDMDPNRSRSRGVELLRLYLEYAASQGRGLADAHKAGAALNAFEADVYDALTAKGIPLVPQWGVSGYRIDFVAQHPDKPGAFVLAIECDGASYHSTPTARDRDRLRQQQLEALGWTFHRIWSTDWYFRREEEIGRAVGAYERAVKRYEERGAQVAAVEPAALVASNSPAPANVSLQSRLPQRGPRPSVNKRSKIDEYSDEELVMLVKWIKSDGLERIDDEIMREMLAELGFQKLGSRIKEAIRQAINATRDERGAKGGHT
jgi:very-short-patch-repair endonuclease